MANYIKANNTTALNTSGSWTVAGVPTQADTVQWNSTVTGANSVALGGALNVKGVIITNPGGAVTIGTTAANFAIDLSGIDMSTATQNLTIASPVILYLINGSSQSWNIASGRTLTISSVLNGTGAWTKNGAGTVVLTANTAGAYTTGPTIAAGTVRVGSSGALGTGTITMTGGALSSDSTTSYTLANALSLNGTMTLGDATNTEALTFSGTTTIAGPTTLTIPTASAVILSGSLTGGSTATLAKGGAGDLLLVGTGNNSGNVTLNAGNVLLAYTASGTPDQFNSVPTITLAGGFISYRGNTATTITSALTGSTGGEVYVRNTSAAGLTFSGSWSGLQRPVNIYADAAEGGATAQTLHLTTNTATAFSYLLMNNQSSVTVNQTLRYSGTSTWTCGQPLLLYRLAAAGIRGILYNSSSGNITWSGIVRNEVAFPVTFELKNDSSGVTTISGNISELTTGKLALEKTGSGTATLTGANSFTNPANVLAGTLNANSATALGSNAIARTFSVTSGATLSIGAGANYSSPAATTSISGTGVGGTTGALVINYAGNVNVGAITLGGPTLIRGTANGGNLTSNISGTQNLTLRADVGVTTTFSGIIGTSTGTLSVTGNTGTIALAGQNTFSGTMTLSSGSVRLDAAQTGLSSGPLGSNNAAGSLIFTGSTTSDGILEYTTANTFDYSARFSGPTSGQAYINTNVPTSLTVTWAGSWATNASVFDYSIGKFGGGTLRMTSTGNTRLGVTYIYDGVVSFVSGSLSTVSFNGPNAILKWEPGNTQDKSAALNFPNSYGNFDTNGNDVTFAYSPWGLGIGLSITKLGLGSLTLTARSYSGSGTTTITAGSIRAGQVDAFGTSSGVVVGANGKLETLTASGQNGKLTIRSLDNSAGGVIKIGG